jgi:hypothetical protein
MGNKWNDQWWSLVKAERVKEEERLRVARKHAKRATRRKQKQR